jgi:tetratricopeptide (TPR) repeat protein
MQVFLSWSGTRSRKLAHALHLWLKPVIQAAEPWMSDSGVDAGQRWTSEIALRLRDTNFGILCVTPENVAAPWLLFEAGVLAKSMDNARVVPLLFDIAKSDLPFPLAQFQAVATDRDGMLSLVMSANAALGSARLTSEVLAQAFNDAWPRFERALATIPASNPNAITSPAPAPTERQMLAEVAEGIRDLRQVVAQLGLERRDNEPPLSASTDDERWEDHFTRAVDLANRHVAGSDLAALRAYNEAIAAIPVQVDQNLKARLFSYRGAMFKRLHRLDEAMSDLLLAGQLASERYEIEDVKYNIACVFAMQGEAEAAIESIRDLINRDEKWRHVVSQRANTYFRNVAKNSAFLALVRVTT